MSSESENDPPYPTGYTDPGTLGLTLLSLFTFSILCALVVITLGTVFHLPFLDHFLPWDITKGADYPAWCLANFVIGGLGATLDILFLFPEVGLNTSPGAATIAIARPAIVPAVVGVTLFTIVTLTQPYLSEWILVIFALQGTISAATVSTILAVLLVNFIAVLQFLAFALPGANLWFPTCIYSLFGLMALSVYASPLYATLPVATLFLAIGFQASAYLDTTGTYLFHFLSAIGGVFQARALTLLGPDFVNHPGATGVDNPILVGGGTLATPSASDIPNLIPTIIIVYIAVPIVFSYVAPVIYSKWRQPWTNLVWNQLYVALISLPAVYPVQINEAEFSHQKKIRLDDYVVSHDRATGFTVAGCPGDEIPKSNYLGTLFSLITQAFFAIKQLDHYFPQSRIFVPVQDKARCDVSAVGQNLFQQYYPDTVRAKLNVLDNPSAAANNYYLAGQWLAYLAQFGHAVTMLEKSLEPAKGAVLLDYNFMHRHEVKQGMKRYGGKAYFDWTRSTDPDEPPKLVLKSVETPDGLSYQAPKLPRDWKPLESQIDLVSIDINFKHAQDLIASSSLAHVVMGKHCAGHHSYFNLIAVAINNAFDAEPWITNKYGIKHPHPIRTAILPHFYNHIVVEEKTTAHLLEDLAVFPQVFAFTHPALADYYNLVFAKLHFLQDADLSKRLGVLGYDYTDAQLTDVHGTVKREFTSLGSLRREEKKDERVHGGLPQQIDPTLQSQISWEVSYYRLLFRYATSIVDAVYKIDDDVAKDPAIKRLHDELRYALSETNKKRKYPDQQEPRTTLTGAPTDSSQVLPERFGTLSTKSTLARFIADSIFCVSIRHEIYGKIITRYGFDYALIQTQVATDYGPPAIEDYMSLLYVALATSRPKYIPFMYDYAPYLQPLAQTPYYEPLRAAEYAFQDQLTEANRIWTADARNVGINLNFNRPRPDELCPGSCY